MILNIDARAALRTAFANLRKQGWTARMNFWCCQTCAWSALSACVKETDNVVFFHGQDNASLKADDECYLAWQGDGRALVEALRATGLQVKWNGSKGTRIHIKGGTINVPDPVADRELCEVP